MNNQRRRGRPSGTVADMTKPICITLPRSTLVALKAYYIEEDFSSRSAAIASIIDDYLSSRTKKEEAV